MGDAVDFVCEGDTAKSVFSILTGSYSQQLKTTPRGVCFFRVVGVYRFMAGKMRTDILIIALTLFGALISGPWSFIDFIAILTGNYFCRYLVMRY
ncbi:hypothetical protein V4B17_01825 [Bartonella sp. B23]